MKIRLDCVVDEPFDWQETLSLAGGDLGRSEIVKLGEVACRGRIRPLAVGYLFEASLSYVQALRCMRCLEPFDVPVASQVSLLIEVRRRETTEEELELREEDLGFFVLRTPELETRPILEEQLQLEIPMKPLCREDCAGLCAGCGQDLNRGACHCGAAVTDRRWSALGTLKL